MIAGGGSSCDALEVAAADEPCAGSDFDAGVAMLGRRGGGLEWNDGGPRLRMEKADGRRSYPGRECQWMRKWRHRHKS